MSAFEAAVLTLFVYAAFSVVWFTLRTGISPMPSTMPARRAMLELAGTIDSGTIYELGSGWGGLAIALARRFPNATIIGYELSVVPYLYSVLIARLLGLSNLRFRRADFRTATFEEGGLIFCYLFPGGMEALSVKLNAEKTGSVKVISNTFRLPGLEASRTIELDDLYRSRVYLYDGSASGGEIPNRDIVAD